MKFLITLVLAAVIFGLGEHFLGENVMFWFGLTWLLVLLAIDLLLAWRRRK